MGEDFEVKKILAVGKDGEIEKIIDASKLLSLGKKLPPLIKLNVYDKKFGLDAFNCFFVEHIQGKDKKKDIDVLVRSFVDGVFTEWGRFGPDGDIMSLTLVVHGNQCHASVDYIGNLEFAKPALAADLPIFIRDKNWDVYFVGIVRANKPNRGEPALMGGFLDLNGFHLETPIEALFREGREEVNFRVLPRSREVNNIIKEKVYPDEVDVSVVLGGKEYKTQMFLVDTFKTSDAEKKFKTGHKRVDWTTAYTVLIDVKEDLDCQKVASFFKAGSDAKSVFVFKALTLNGVGFKTPALASKNHRKIFERAVRVLQEKKCMGIAYR